LYISYILRGLATEILFEGINVFYPGLLKEDSDSFPTYVQLSYNLCTLSSQISSLLKSYVTNKGIFRYYLITKIFFTLKQIISLLGELVRVRKTYLIIDLWMKNPTDDQIENLNDKICVICRDEMTQISSKILSCGHIFHSKCLRSWLKKQYCCPTCLSPISSGSFYSFVKRKDFGRVDLKSLELNSINGIYGMERNLFLNNSNKRDKFIKDLPDLKPNICSLLLSLNNNK